MNTDNPLFWIYLYIAMTPFTMLLARVIVAILWYFTPDSRRQREYDRVRRAMGPIRYRDFTPVLDDAGNIIVEMRG